MVKPKNFWADLKLWFINSLKQSKIDSRLPISQRKAIIKLIDTDKKIALPNVDVKKFLNHF